MKKSAILKKLEQHVEKIYDSLDEITTLLEVDLEDDELCEMSTEFRKQLEQANSENEECNYNDILEYIGENY
jgi:hypothetical protein